MAHIIDLGGAPASEDCAQLGVTEEFDTVNGYEVFAYKLAIIARFGEPPAGCRLKPLANRHDFGTYRTLSLRVDDEEDEKVQAYATAVEEGLGTWIEAGFSPPVSYAGSNATIHRLDPTELLIGALQTTRPDADGRFPIPDFEALHTNLAAAFPHEAELARTRLSASQPTTDEPCRL